MKVKGLKGWQRIIIALSGLALLAVLVLPIWKIQLAAPQYPEGLELKIFANKLGGNVEIVNGLNHYIGMKTLHADDFKEFVYLRYIIGFFALCSLLVAGFNTRKGLFAATGLYLLFAILAMVDFWRWEYDYGHNLNPNAAIQVPGMTYQPPLIGYKQLLNFGAYSIPDIGGWIMAAVGVVLLLCVILQWKRKKLLPMKEKTKVAALGMAALILISSCSSGPVPIKPGVDNCHFCKMRIADIPPFQA